MRPLALLLMVTTLCFFSPSPAYADETLTSTTSTTAFTGAWGDSTGTHNRSAQRFTPTINGTVGTIAIYYLVNNFPTHIHTDDIVVSIQSDSSGSPSGTDLTELYQFTPTDGASCHTRTVNFASPASVTASTDYWIVYSRSGSLSDASYYGGCGDDTASSASFPLKKYSSSSWAAEGNSWNMNTVITVTSAAAATSDSTSFDIL